MTDSITLPREVAERILSALEESVDTMANEYDADWRHGLPTRKAQLEAMRQVVQAHRASIVDLRAALSEQCSAARDEAMREVGGG